MTRGSFDFPNRTRILFAPGGLERLGEWASSLGGTHAFLVTDPGIVAAGYVERAQTLLEQAGMSVRLFEDVPENPTTVTVIACAEIAREYPVDLLIGLGGGSAMDTAKGANFLLTNGGQMPDYRGYGKVRHPLLPMIAVPTTAGTGSEVQSYAVLSDAETHQKMACGDPTAAPRIALLDPELTLTCPRRVTAHAGIDAIAHAVETMVTARRNPFSTLFSREAFHLLTAHFSTVLETPDHRDARSNMLLGATYAGLAIETSMLGAAHSMANPLTAHFNMVHGQAVGMVLPYVLAFNAQDADAAGQYADLMTVPDVIKQEQPAQVIEELLLILQHLLNIAGFPASLKECAVPEETIPMLAKEAATQWTAQFNPRPITESDFVTLYRDAWIGDPPILRR